MQTASRHLLLGLLALISRPVWGEAIEDNSFLLEEAYNQEPGVVQFIQTYQKDKSGDSFYSLTTELPAPDQNHQLSFMIPYSHITGTPDDTNGVGDIGLNYRYQLFNTETVAIAPRISILLPTGDDEKGLGTGVTGLQTNWAISVKVNPALVLHMNVGATYLPGVKVVGADSQDLFGENSAMSLVWLVSENFNLLTEFVSSSMGELDGSVSSSAVINPGFRCAVNFEKSQLVLGASAPTLVLYSQGASSYFAYVSYEPKLW